MTETFETAHKALERVDEMGKATAAVVMSGRVKYTILDHGEVIEKDTCDRLFVNGMPANKIIVAEGHTYPKDGDLHL